MTAPATQPPPPQTAPPAQLAPPPPAVPAQLLVAMVLPLAGLLLTAATATAVITALMLRFKLGRPGGLFWLALHQVLSMVMANPPAASGTIGPASQRAGSLNLAARAQFALASAERITQAMIDARARGGDIRAAAEAQMERERRYFQQHLDAARQRGINAMRIDMQVLEHGMLLGWYSRRDDRVTPECARANGRNFYADAPPFIGMPGIGPHAGCRCYPGAPWPAGKLLPGSQSAYRRAA
jgi:hypothetical protein